MRPFSKTAISLIRKTFVLIIIFAVFASLPLFAKGNGRGGSNGQADISAIEKADLLFMREEEKMARDVYDELYEFYKESGVELLIFARIASSEQNHMDAMLTLLIKYGLSDPAEGNTRGEFENQIFADLYQNLVSDDINNEPILNEPEAGGKVGPLEALYVGAWIEERDMLDIMQAISNTKKSAIVRVYTNLLCGSRNHLRSFVGQIGEDDYDAQILVAPEDVGQETVPEETLEYWLGGDSDEICG